MKLIFKKSTLIKIARFLKWTKWLAKLAALGTTITGAVAAATGSASTGAALSVAGATTFAASKGLNAGYEKTKHVPPGRVDKQANILRQREIEQSMLKPQNLAKAQPKLGKGSLLSAKQPASRPMMGMPSGTPLVLRKK